MSTNERTDWSAYNAKFGRRNSTEFAKRRACHEPPPGHPLSDTQLGLAAAGNSDVTPASPDDLGAITRFKANRIAQDAALTQIRDTLAAQIEVTRYYLGCLVGAKKAKIEVELKEYVAVLDAERLRLTAEFDIALFEERGQLLKRLQDSYLRQARAIMDADMPEDEMDLMVSDLREMRMELRDYIKENFSKRYQRPGTIS